MTEKQKRFADYYLETANATEAAIRAGYSEKTAKEIGYENLMKPHIKKYIEERNKALESERVADMREVREFWSETMRNKNLENKDRLKASEMIAKANGAFVNKMEHSGSVNILNQLDQLSDEELDKLLDE